MTQLTDIIDIQITRETAAVAQTNFNIPLFISAHTNFSERARAYSSLSAVAEDFGTSTNTYIAASKLFGQQLRPATIIVGRRHVPSVTVNVLTVGNNLTYVMTISGTPITFVSPSTGSTAITIATGLKAAYDLSPVTGVTVTDNLDGTLTVASAVGYSLIVSANLNKADSPATESWPDTLEAVQAANDTWYAVTIESHVQADVLAMAGAVEGKKKIFGTSSQDVAVKSSGTTDAFAQLFAATYQRTFGLYSPTADTEFPECAWIGYQLQEQPGSNTWAYKQLSGVTVSTLSDTEANNIKAKNGNTYERIGGLNVTVGGKMFGGEWIDVMVFVDWLEARMKERLWFRLANSKKIPYTAAGAAILEAEVRAQLNDGIRVGGLADSPAPVVRTVDVLSVAPNLRAQRIYDGIEFEARLAGAIHFVKIRGTVTV